MREARIVKQKKKIGMQMTEIWGNKQKNIVGLRIFSFWEAA